MSTNKPSEGVLTVTNLQVEIVYKCGYNDGQQDIGQKYLISV